jgi:hypothetical protein
MARARMARARMARARTTARATAKILFMYNKRH